MKPYWIPTAAEIDHFLVPYNLPDEALVEQIEIRKNGVFEFMMLAIWLKSTDEVSLIVMWPEEDKKIAHAEMT